MSTTIQQRTKAINIARSEGRVLVIDGVELIFKRGGALSRLCTKKLAEISKKWCSLCRKVLSLENFYLDNRCKQCNSIRKGSRFDITTGLLLTSNGTITKLSKLELLDNRQKWCPKCKKILPFEDFTFPKYLNGMPAQRCKQCEIKCDYRRRFSRAKFDAKQKGRQWLISFNEYINIIQEKCYYCGFEVVCKTIGLDRIDNTSDYTLKNVVSCCSDCNTMRWDNFTFDEMKILGLAIKEAKLARLNHVELS